MHGLQSPSREGSHALIAPCTLVFSGWYRISGLNPEEISVFQVGECVYQLELSGDVGLAEWLMTHCSQNESVSMQPEDNGRTEVVAKPVSEARNGCKTSGVG